MWQFSSSFALIFISHLLDHCQSSYHFGQTNGIKINNVITIRNFKWFTQVHYHFIYLSNYVYSIDELLWLLSVNQGSKFVLGWACMDHIFTQFRKNDYQKCLKSSFVLGRFLPIMCILPTRFAVELGCDNIVIFIWVT